MAGKGKKKRNRPRRGSVSPKVTTKPVVRPKEPWTSHWKFILTILVAAAGTYVVWATSRANIVATETRFMTKLEAGQPFGAQIHFSNVGKTNAKALKGRACLGHGVTLDPNQECVEPTYISVEDLGPTVGRSYIITLKPPPTKELVDVIMSGRERYFVFGWVTYEDMIGLSHRTEFCGEYDTRASGPMYATLCDSRNNSH